MDSQDTTAKAGVSCPNCARSFNCAGPPECWCLKVEHDFDWEGFIMRTGITSCLCPVCLTGTAGAGAGADAAAPGGG